MSVIEAIASLKNMPEDASLVVADIMSGGIVPVQGFDLADNGDVEVEFCEDEDCVRMYGHPPQ